MASLTARAIWNSLPRATREEAAAALWSDAHVERADRVRALVPWLAARGVRIQYLEKLPRTRRAALMAQGGVPEETAYQLLISFHLVHRRELLAAFLDALEIPHDGGLISPEAEVEPPGREVFKAAVDSVRGRFDDAEVDLYLRTLFATDPVTWAAAEEHLGETA